MSYSLYNPFLFSAFLDPRTFKNDEPSGGGGDDNNDPPPATVYENDYSDPNNPKLDTDPNTPGTQTSGGSQSSSSSSQTIQSGDTVSQLALDNNTTIEQIKADNPGIDINNIKAGETINITSNTRNDNESIYTGVTQSELDAGNSMSSSSDDATTYVDAATGQTTSASGLTTTTLPNGREVYLDEGGEFVGFVPDPEQQGTRSDAVDEALVANHGWTLGADGDAYPTAEAAAAAGSTYDDLDGALTTVTTDAEETTSTSGGRNLDADLGIGGSEATVTASELLNDDIDNDNITTYVTTGGGGVTLSDDNTTALDQIISGESTAEDLQGANIDLGSSTTETETGVDLTEIDDGDGTDFSVVPGDTRDDVYFDLSDPSERLVTGNGVGFTGTYGGVTYTDGYEVKEPLQVEITPGDNIGTSIEGALGTGTTVDLSEIDDGGGTDFSVVPGGGTSTVDPSITPERLEDLQGYVDSLTSMQGGYTEADLDAAGFTASEILAFEQGLSVPGLTQEDIDAMGEQYGTLQEAPNTFESAANALKGGSDLTLGEIAAGLGYDTVGGFLEELSLRVQGTGTMADDALSILSSYNIDQYEFTDPNTGEKVIADLDGVDRTGTTSTAASEALAPAVKYLSEQSKEILNNQSDEYKKLITDGMPDPNNEGYNMAGEKITPGAWMASVAAQELIGLGLDVGTVMLLGPVAGGAVAFQQGTAEAGAAAANETKTELESLRASGALDHLSEEEFNTVVDTAETQAFYTSGLAGGAVDTLVALTAGGFAPLAKALPTAINSALTGLGVLTAEGVSGGLEQVGVNAAVIKALEDQGINPADYDKGYLDQVLTAAIYETVGGTGASAASTVGSAVQNLSAKSDGALTTAGDDTQTGTGSTYDDLGGALTQTNTQGVNTIDTQTVTDAEGQTHTVDTAVDANGNTSVTVTNDLTGSSTTTDVGTGTLNSVNVGTGTSIIVDTSNTSNTNEVETTVLESGSSLTQTGADGVTGEETTVGDLTNTENAVIGGTDQNVVVSNVGGNTIITNEETGLTVSVGSGTNANLTNATNAVQNDDAAAAVAAGAVVVDTSDVTAGSTASETLLGGTDDDTNVVSLYDSGKVYRRDGVMYLGNPANNVKAEGVIDGTLYSDGQVVVGMGESQTGTGGIGTIVTGGTTTGVTGTGGTTTGVTGTGDATTGVTGTGTGDANTTITANNDATVTTSSDGNVTVTTVTDANGNATVTTNNSVTGETTTDNVAVNSTATVTNGGVTVDVDAATDGTATTTVETAQTGVSSEVDGVVDVGTTADAVVQAATTTTVEQPVVDETSGTDVTGTDVTGTDVTGTDDDDTTVPVGESIPGYTSGIAGLGTGVRPVVSPYYQPQQTGAYNFYVPQPGVDQTVPAGPVMSDPTSYLAPTANPQYGYGYIAPNAELEYLRRLAQIQGTGDELLPSEDLMSGS